MSLVAWRNKLADSGWGMPQWPREWHGRGLPAGLVREAAIQLLQHRVPIVEAAVLPPAIYPAHVEEIGRAALHRKVAAVVGAGWNPGALSVFGALFEMLSPHGHSEVRDRPGVSLHHTLATRAIAGVKDALCTELRTAAGTTQRYVYLELEPGADLERATHEIRADPLFLDEETLVLPVDSVAALEDEGHGVVGNLDGLARLLGNVRVLSHDGGYFLSSQPNLVVG
jgi:diaminopimelate dehydrogenase